MGYYIETGKATNKALWLVENHGGELVARETAFRIVESYEVHDQGIVVVMDNGPFQAAGFAYDLDEFLQFADPTDPRPRQYVKMNRELAAKLSNFVSNPKTSRISGHATIYRKETGDEMPINNPTGHSYIGEIVANSHIAVSMTSNSNRVEIKIWTGKEDVEIKMTRDVVFALREAFVRATDWLEAHPNPS